jgi:hypothetical protein
MDINKYISKKVLIYICIIIIILIIFRVLYTTFNSEIENFSANNCNATDLLTKFKSGSAQNGINLNSSDLELQIFSWSNYLYNINNSSNTIKPIAFYKPILTINSNTYSKLGDIVSTNTDYSLPTPDQFTLLIKKNTSDIKTPLRFELIVNTNTDSDSNSGSGSGSSSGSSSSSGTTTNNSYLQYINGISNSILLNISNNLSPCSAAIDNLNSLIENNMTQLNTNFAEMIYTDASITLAKKTISISRMLNTISPKVNSNLESNSSDNLTNDGNGLLNSIIMLDKEIENIIEGFKNENFTDDYSDFLPNIDSSLSTTYPTQNPFSNNNTIQFEILSDSILILPAGIQGFINYTDNNNNNNTVDISIPANLDSLNDTNSIINSLSVNTYNNITTNNIVINKYPKETKSIFSYIPLLKVIEYIDALCTDIQNIYNQPNIANLLLNLKLAQNSDIINSLLTITNMYLNNENIHNLPIQDFFNDLDKANIKTNDTSNLLGLVLNIIRNMSLTYNLTYLSFKPSDIGIISNNNMKITITRFNNDIVSNIPKSSYSILSNTNYIPLITNLIPNIDSFLEFISNNTGGGGGGGGDSSKSKATSRVLPPLCIYNPIAPNGYVSLGHVFCNSVSDLEKIIAANNVACVPSHCVREIRKWIANDKIFEYKNNNVYWAIYLNPYTGTFISTSSAGQMPPGKVCKVVACVSKNNSVDKLKKADECIRQYYNINKQATMNSPISSKLVSDQEEVFYLDKIKAQSDSIARLEQRSKQMQTDIDKATIINREMNKNKLQDYTDTQKRNMNLIMQKLKADKNKIQTNINVPENTLKDIINMLNNLPKDQQNKIIDVLNSNNIISKPQMNQIINSCPQYDLSGLVTKQMASDVCYGCDNPM